MFVEIRQRTCPVSDFVRRVKGRSSHRVQMNPGLAQALFGRFWALGYFSTTSGNITDDVILQYLQEHNLYRRQSVGIQFRINY